MRNPSLSRPGRWLDSGLVAVTLVLGGLGLACSPSSSSGAGGSSSRAADDAGAGGDLAQCTYVSPPVVYAPRDLRLPLARNESRAPGRVEVRLTAAPFVNEYLVGKETPAWGYNGVVPGPLIEARLGDRLVVRFTNGLSEPTTIHWHGVHVPADMDGATVMRDPVWPGETFTYEFPLKDAGLFWYHPHAHETVQMERGLYGALVVRDGKTVAPGVTERILVLQDILVDNEGALIPDEAIIVGEGHTAAQAATSVHTQEMLGRQGNVVLVNGKAFPALTVRAGTWERWRLINASAARYYDLRLQDHGFVQIGSDGGFLEEPLRNPRLLFTPGERLDLLVYFGGQPGDRKRLFAETYSRRRFTSGGRLELAEIRYDDSPAPAVAPPLPVPSRLRTIEKLDPSPDVKRLVFRELIVGGSTGHDHGGVASSCAAQIPYPGRYAFTINGESYPDVTPLPAKLGETQTWDLVNLSWMDHPFHLHGFFFQPLAVGGVAPPLQWKDTINVPYGEIVRVAVRPTDYQGTFLYHCHIIQHGSAGGMMGELRVSRD